MRRMTAAVLASAAVAVACAGIAVSADVDAAVRAEVVVAGEGHPLDVRRIRIVDGLSAGRSYRLPAIGIRNRRGLPTTFGLVVASGAARRWLLFVPDEVAIDAGRSRVIGMRLRLPDDAEPGLYAVVLGVRPGGVEGAHLTFRVEPAASAGRPLRRAASLVLLMVPALVGGLLVVVRARLTCRAPRGTPAR